MAEQHRHPLDHLGSNPWTILVLRRHFPRFHVSFKDAAVRGEYVEVVPNRRVVFTWGWETPGAAVGPGGSTVEIDLEPRGKGTRLRLVHRGLPAAELASHSLGWDHFLPRLVAVAEGGSVPAEA